MLDSTESESVLFPWLFNAFMDRVVKEVNRTLLGQSLSRGSYMEQLD